MPAPSLSHNKWPIRINNNSLPLCQPTVRGRRRRLGSRRMAAMPKSEAPARDSPLPAALGWPLALTLNFSFCYSASRISQKTCFRAWDPRQLCFRLRGGMCACPRGRDKGRGKTTFVMGTCVGHAGDLSKGASLEMRPICLL